ncbi:MAG: DUF3943 domain-containing protein [Polyangiaceae bacterium]|nr:DUF3943 domain-containing protein [Polyangiaceae bacterium]
MEEPRAPRRPGRVGRRGQGVALALGLGLLGGAAPARAEDLFGPPDPRIVEAMRRNGITGTEDLLWSLPLTPQVFPVRDSPDWIVLPGFSMSLERVGEELFGGPLAPHRLRAILAMTGFLGVEIANYWIGRDLNAPDWELSWTWPSWEKKVVSGEGLSLDTNRFETNTVMHPFAGTVYYLAARGNDLGLVESFALSLLASTAWEYVAEFREKVSINDLIMTPAAGLAVGEPLDRLSRFFSAGDGVIPEMLGVLTSPFRALSDVVTEGTSARAERLDELGLPADTWHHFDLFVGAAAIPKNGELRAPETQLGVSFDLYDVPEFERPVAVERPVWPGDATRLSLQASLEEGDLARFDFHAQTSLGGYLWQDLEAGQDGPSGYNFSVGAATGFGYSMHDWGGWVDKLGAANLLGVTADLGLYESGLRLRVGASAFADFSAVSSAAIAPYLRERGSRGIRSILADRQYYFALGGTFGPGASLGYRGVELGADVQAQVFESIEGLDRYQAQVTREVDLHDYRLAHRAWLAYTLPGNRLKVTWLTLEQRHRSGSVDTVRSARSETRLLGGLSLLF